ncbi:MAG: PAS domain S-box protein [Pseudomonadota bacterium]
MNSENIEPEQTDGLRRRAEKMTPEKAGRSSEYLTDLSPDDSRRLVHELRVHEIELTVQNEELRRAQAELEATRARYFDLYNLAPVGYVTLSRKGLILEANLTIATQLGVTRDQLIDQPISRFIHKEDQDHYYHFRNRLSRKGRQACELRMLHANASSFWVHLISTAAGDDDGPPLFHVVLYDITDRKRAEEALQQSEERHRTILQTAMDGFWMTDLRQRLLEVNETYCRMSGYGAEELMTMRISDLEVNKTDEYIAAHRQKIMAQGEDRFESRHRRKNGSIFDVEVSVQYQPAEGGRFVAFLRDITERKRAEERLRILSSRLLTAQEEEQHRIAMELHDQTGQDLNVLKLQLALLQNRLRKDQAALKEEVGKILTFTDGVIEDVRRLAHGLSPSQLQLLGLRAALRALIRNFSEKTCIPIQFDVDALDKALPAETEIVLYRIFQEALTNIYKHARAETVRIEVNRRGDALSIEIQDDGQGFDPCRYRSSEPTADRGMGLSALELRARMIGAEFRISSQPGQGTRIRLLVPTKKMRSE